jgi:hypothetical protein
MSRKMKILLAAAAPVVITALGFMTVEATAGSSIDSGKVRLARPAAHSVVQHPWHVMRRPSARREFAHRESVGGFNGGWRGYVYVPGQGIADEACNLPTSTCPNDRRDVQ